MNRFILSLVLITLATLSSSAQQEGLWMHAYSYREDDPDRHIKGRNRTIISLTTDSLYTFDSGKEEWKGGFARGLKYTRKGDGYEAADERLKSPIYFKQKGENEIDILAGDTHMVLRRVATSPIKRMDKKLTSFIFNSFFTLERWGTTDTLSFFNRDFNKKYTINDINTQLVYIDQTLFFLTDMQEGNLFPVVEIKKNSISLMSMDSNNHELILKKIDLSGVQEKEDLPVLMKDQKK